MYFKILLIIMAIAYLISPLDLIPDLFVPWVGWIDDTFLLGLLIYYLRFGKLPNIFYRGGRPGWGGGRYNNPDANTGEEPHRKNEGLDGQGRNKRKEENKEKTRAPHEILGIDPGASREEIQAAYRKAVKAYHPDRVANLGPELQELAARKFIEIKEAYNRLMKL